MRRQGGQVPLYRRVPQPAWPQRAAAHVGLEGTRVVNAHTGPAAPGLTTAGERVDPRQI